MVRRTSRARVLAVDAAACRAAKRIAALAVMSHRWGETDAEADRGLRAAASAVVESTKPRRVKRGGASPARASRLRSVPAGHRSRRAASSRVRPSK